MLTQVTHQHGDTDTYAQDTANGLPRPSSITFAGTSFYDCAPAGVAALLGELRAEAKRRGIAQVAFASASRWWSAARAAGYRRPWRDAMHVFEREL